MEGIPINNVVLNDAMTMLKKTSRTFYIPISHLDTGLREAVASAYLCMRAIDEVEDHPDLNESLKVEILMGIQETFNAPNVIDAVTEFLLPYREQLPEVSWRLDEWLNLCPSSAAPIVNRYIQKMSLEMAEWAACNWKIETEEDLDRYTYSVAGMVGEMLSDLWFWNDGTQSDSVKAIGFGRGLQAVNILRNRAEDRTRGVDFFPKGWEMKDMMQYTRRNLELADSYIADLKEGPALKFCKIPLALANATVKLIGSGGNKLTRDAVLKIVSRL
ncbi:squalene/phytoene synthase family protein [Paenibacillus ferrarius]|nr:phytoene/squalene synthase family protein [Paenibacillus ferrarius]